jgi:hypothetical protein
MHKFRFHLLRIIRADFDPHRLDILFVSRYPTTPSEDRPIARSIARSLDRLLGRSLDRSVDRSVAQSVARALGRSFGRSVSRSVHLPPCLSPSPYLVFPTLSPAYLTLRPPHLDLLIGTKHFICFECSKMHSASFVF